MRDLQSSWPTAGSGTAGQPAMNLSCRSRSYYGLRGKIGLQDSVAGWGRLLREY